MKNIKSRPSSVSKNEDIRYSLGMNQKKASWNQRHDNNWLYPPTEAYNEFYLKVSDLHEIRVEECGNPKGKPVIFLHGGPGGGANENYRRFFNPERYRIVLFDQRGAGKSRPHAELQENTTWDLVNDIETIRKKLEIEKWQVFGGSWGSTLALTYAISQPEKVSELVLRGIFLLRQKELNWFYQEGASYLFPDSWRNFRDHIPLDERSNLLAAYHKRLNDKDPSVQKAAAREWSLWELRTSKLFVDHSAIEDQATEDFLLAFARIETHYFKNKGFFDSEDFVFKNLDKIRNIPSTIVQGRYDVVCPIESAFELHEAWPEARYIVIPDAGHSAFETGIARALVATTDEYSHLNA